MDTRTLILFSLVPTALGHLVNTRNDPQRRRGIPSPPF